MAHVRYINQVTFEETVLLATDLKQARNLFKYARSCATADTQIELINDAGVVVSAFRVEYVDHIPAHRPSPRHA